MWERWKRPTSADQLGATSCFMTLACFGEPMARGRASHLCQLANCRRRLNQSLVTRCRITPHVEPRMSAHSGMMKLLFDRALHHTCTTARRRAPCCFYTKATAPSSLQLDTIELLQREACKFLPVARPTIQHFPINIARDLDYAACSFN